MTYESRMNTIGAMQKILRKEAFEAYSKNSKAGAFSPNNKNVDELWEQCSSVFTRIWLSYMSDNQLQELVQKKMIMGKHGADIRNIGSAG